MSLPFKERSRRRDMRKVLYRLRRRWGVPGTLYQVDPGTLDLDTGQTTDVKTKYDIPNLLTWTVSEQFKFEYDLAFVAANKNFTYGAVFEIGDRIAILDAVYLPKGFKIRENDYVVYNARRYDLKRWDILDGEAGYLLHLRHTQGTLPGQIIEIKYRHRLNISQDIAGEL